MSAQPSCETKEEVTTEQLDRTRKGLEAMLKELKNASFFQAELKKAASAGTPSEQMPGLQMPGRPCLGCVGDAGGTGMDETGRY